jgi:light-regulated signal transduction histidine kinase (bacteriophytochrome)
MCGAALDATCHEFIHEILSGANQINELIYTLLKFSEVNRAQLKMSSVDLSEIAVEIAKNLNKSSQSCRQVEFRIKQGVIVIGDKKLIKVLLSNLIGNAWKYSAKRDEAVIEFGNTEINGKMVYFVRDNGIGFESEVAGNLFAPFKRLDNSDGFEGTGVGLATVQRIIQRHGGDVWGEGELDKGSTFYFTLGSDEP